jgi:hypothetical protein
MKGEGSAYANGEQAKGRRGAFPCVHHGDHGKSCDRESGVPLALPNVLFCDHWRKAKVDTILPNSGEGSGQEKGNDQVFHSANIAKHAPTPQ